MRGREKIKTKIKHPQLSFIFLMNGFGVWIYFMVSSFYIIPEFIMIARENDRFRLYKSNTRLWSFGAFWLFFLPLNFYSCRFLASETRRKKKISWESKPSSLIHFNVLDFNGFLYLLIYLAVWKADRKGDRANNKMIYVNSS